jgi:hypothetical protein
MLALLRPLIFMQNVHANIFSSGATIDAGEGLEYMEGHLIVTIVCLRRRTVSNMLRILSVTFSKMLRLANLENPRRRCCCAVLVLLAVCTLTVRVATRYCYSHGPSDAKLTIVHKHSSSESVHQRMTKSAPMWLPPVVRWAVLQSPGSYPRVAPAGPPVLGLVLEKSLYNRPPPAC